LAESAAQGKVLSVAIHEEMKRSYIDYAMSVIVSRALPDVRDGLKPVHRRILYAMFEQGITPDKPHRKSARVVGEVLGKYHPHNDVAVYDAMVRMAQDFASRYPLVDGHGNFGSIDGDSPAAMRYTEVRMARLATEMLADIRKDTVDFGPNFDESLEEPLVLPSRFPNLLINGSSGIAVGMATNIPPHNLREVAAGLCRLIDNPEASADDLMRDIKGPDFPTGGLILGREGIRDAYRTGRGIIRMRARGHIDHDDRGRARILVTELPYQVNKARLIEKIADLARERRIEGISDLRDESDLSGLRVVIELRRDANPNVVLNRLYKYTAMEQTFGAIMLALVDGKPQIMDLREILHHYLEHQKQVVIRRSRFDLERAEARAHILEGLRIALDDIDRVISLIRASETVDSAREGLMREFGLSEKQAQAILEMRLQRLTGLEREKIEEEYAALQATIAELRAILDSEQRVLEVVKEELLAVVERFGDERRTTITRSGDDIEEEDLIAEQDVVITLTNQGYIKRLPASTYRSQRRGGRGVFGMQTKEEDWVAHLFVTTTHHLLLFLTDQGRVFRLKAYEVPELSRQAKGTAVVNLLQLAPGEVVRTVIPLRETGGEGYMFLATRQGMVKKTPLADYDNVRRSGIIAVTLNEGDDLVGGRVTSGKDDILLVTRQGQAIRFPEGNVRPMGRGARGVKGIRLSADDELVGLAVCDREGDLFIVTERGLGKRTRLDDYPVQNRGGRGVRTQRITDKSGAVAAARAVRAGWEMLLVSSEGIVIRFRTDDVPVVGRNTQGVHLMRLDPGDKVESIAPLHRNEEEAE